MRTQKTEAVVLQARDFQELDRLITFFTKDFGKLKGVAKGAKRSRRRFGSNIEMFSHVRLRFYERSNSELSIIEAADFIQPFDRLRNDLKRIAYGSYMVELVLGMTGERCKNPSIFDLLVHSLRLLDQERAPSEGYLRAFEIRLLGHLGYMPVLNRCSACGILIQEEGNDLGFNPEKGGVLCGSCLPLYRDSMRISLGTVKTLTLLKEMDLMRIHRIAFSKRTMEETRDAMLSFIHYRMDREIRSLKFMESLEKGN